MITAVDRLGCTSLTLLGGVIDKHTASTCIEDYAALAKDGIAKKIPLPDGKAVVEKKMAVIVVDGVGPLADALSGESEHQRELSQALSRLMYVLVKVVAVRGPTALSVSIPSANA
jgi:hypothetical protein